MTHTIKRFLNTIAKSLPLWEEVGGGLSPHSFKVFEGGLCLLLLLLASCSSEMEKIEYNGYNFVQFSDSIYQMPVTKDNPCLEIPVVMSTKSDVARKVIVDVDPRLTNATEGYHFSIENRNIVIPAGSNTGMVRLYADYAHISTKDSLAVTLRILAGSEATSPIYGDKANIQLVKCLPFNIDDYVGDLLLTCTFPYSTSTTTSYLTSSRRVNDSTLVLCGPFENNRDMTLRFHTGKDNPFDRDIDMKEHVAFTDVNFGQVSMSTVDNAPSYYLPEDRAFVLYLDAYLAGLGSFGTYYYIFQWITPDEAEARRDGLSTLY